MNDTRVDLIYFDAGGGHRAAAQALASVIAEQQRPWQVRLVNLVEVLDPQATFRRATGVAPEDLYNRRLARGWTLGMAQELMFWQGVIRLAHAAILRRLVRHWRRTEPDLVVSLIPNFNRVLWQSVVHARPWVSYVTVMTDLADHPPHFWIEPGQRQHIVCGTARAAAQARAAGYAEPWLHQVSGVILRPDFYRPLAIDRRAERLALGLPADQAVGLVLFGGTGSQAMVAIAEALADTPLILLCGHNVALATRLRATDSSAPRVVRGFTGDVRRYMALADFFIGKPGPASLSEAVHQGLPVITVRNALTMPQERYNTDWVHDNGLGIVLRSWGDIGSGVNRLLVDLPAARERVAAIDNRAVFEVVEILAQVLEPLVGRHDRTVDRAAAAWRTGRHTAVIEVR